MDTLVKNAFMDRDKTQATRRDVLRLQDVTMETKLLVSVIPRAAMLAEPVLSHSSQELIDQSATDQDQHANVLNSTHQMVTAACHAVREKFLTNLDNNATQHQSAMAQDRSLETDQTATDATLAQLTSSQMTEEEPVLDQSQSAHALRDTLLMVTNAKNVQTDKLLIQTTTRDASHNNATKEVKSSLPEITATDVTCAHKDTSQIHKELSASESSQSAAALRCMTQVDTFACHAHHTKLPPTETKDVSQDNAQDSTRFSELLNHAMHAESAKRDLPQITSEEDA
jgi:hypothetical protein